VLLSENVSELKAGFFPALEHRFEGLSDGVPDGLFETYVARVERERLAAKIEKLSEPGDPPLKMGKDTVLMPDETAFAAAAKWKITVPEVKDRNVSEILLRIRYQGDIARIYAGGKLLTDNFYYGQPWFVGLDRVSAGTPFELKILPLRAQAPIYLPSAARLPIPAGSQVADVNEIEVVPVYRVTVDVPRIPD